MMIPKNIEIAGIPLSYRVCRPSLTRKPNGQVEVIPVSFRLGPDPCLSSVRQNATVIGHEVRFFIDHAQKKFGVTRPIVTQDSAPLDQDLLKQRVVSAVKIYEIHRTAKGQRKVFHDGDVRLNSKRSGRRDRYVKVTVAASAIFGHRSKENSQDHRRMAGHHVLDLSIKIRGMRWLVWLHAFEYHECLPGDDADLRGIAKLG